MSRSLSIWNCQREVPVELAALRRRTRKLLELLRIESHDLGVSIVGAQEMARLNETYLHHGGSTDVITFDYREGEKGARELELHGEIFICADEAVIQASRFHVRLPTELTRYIVHGVLHLRGYDDKRADARREMKREENRLLAALRA